jgi:hypothetical protein
VFVKFIQNFINTPIMTLKAFGLLDQNWESILFFDFFISDFFHNLNS